MGCPAGEVGGGDPAASLHRQAAAAGSAGSWSPACSVADAPFFSFGVRFLHCTGRRRPDAHPIIIIVIIMIASIMNRNEFMIGSRHGPPCMIARSCSLALSPVVVGIYSHSPFCHGQRERKRKGASGGRPMRAACPIIPWFPLSWSAMSRAESFARRMMMQQMSSSRTQPRAGVRASARPSS